MNWHAFLLLLALLGTCVSCRLKTPSEQEKTPSSANNVHYVNIVHLTEAAVARDSDPEQDGWSSEAIASKASAHLNHLGDQILDRSETVVATSPDFESDLLVPPASQLDSIMDDGLTMIERWSQVLPATKQHQLDTAIQPLRQLLADYPNDRKYKFKLFRVLVDEDPRDVSTRQYVHFSGRSNAQSREINATWLARWQVIDGSLQLRSIHLESYEQVTLNRSRQFTDLTHSLLAGTASYAMAIQTEIPHWRKHLEYSLGVYNFGHHGIATGDANGDGLPDIYVCQTGGLPNHLYLQQPDGSLRDASAVANVDYLDNTRSALFLDLDNDDDQDLVLALNSGLLFLENVGSAQYKLRARIPSVRQAFSLASADFDQDGLLDVYICVYYGSGDDISELPVPVPYFDAKNGGQNHLIRNLGQWQFEDVTERTGLDEDNTRFSFAATWEDYDEDGDVDLFVVNDFGPNHLYQNTNGHFKNVAPQVGLIDGAFGMSSSFGDYDRDGHLDLYVANMFSAAGKPRHLSTAVQTEPGRANQRSISALGPRQLAVSQFREWPVSRYEYRPGRDHGTLELEFRFLPTSTATVGTICSSPTVLSPAIRRTICEVCSGGRSCRIRRPLSKNSIRHAMTNPNSAKA